jgi:hypothetical protein
LAEAADRIGQLAGRVYMFGMLRTVTYLARSGRVPPGRDQPGGLVAFAIGRRLMEHVRHWHKYAVQEQPPDLWFHFRDASGQVMGVTAGNLQQLHHELVRCSPGSIRHYVHRRDFSRWVFDVFRDHTFARSLESLEAAAVQSESPEARVRQQLLTLIE